MVTLNRLKTGQQNEMNIFLHAHSWLVVLFMLWVPLLLLLLILVSISFLISRREAKRRMSIAYDHPYMNFGVQIQLKIQENY
jgi:hypothetical protein